MWDSVSYKEERGYMEESGLSGIEWAVWKRVGCVEECGLYVRESTVWSRVGYLE